MLDPGFSMAAFYAAVLVNIPLAGLLLWLYRRAVVRAMRTPAEGAMTPAATALAPPAHAAAGDRSPPNDADTRLHGITFLDASEPRMRPASRHVRAAVGATAASGLLYVLVLTAAWQWTLGGVPYASWLAWWFVVLAWPVPLACGIVAGAVGTDWLRLAALHAGLIAGSSALVLALHPALTAGTLLSNAATILLVAVPVAALAYRRIRAVGLLVFAFTLVLLAAAPALFVLLLRGLTRLLALGTPLRPLLASALAAFGSEAVGWHVGAAALAAAALLGFATLRGIGRLYRVKRLSDASLLVDALWCVVTIAHVSLLSTQSGGPGERWAWLAGPLAALATYALVQHGALAWLARRKRRTGAAPLLLLLRVFSLGRRSERLFDVLAARWRHAGAIAFIGGPDLATGTVQPSQFLEFVSGRLQDLFVRSAGDVARRVGEIDLAPDADGLHRVNPLYCFSDTWQAAVRALARRADAVLMDLRGFSAVNQGCAYELEHLLASVPRSRVLLVVDATTDATMLDATLRRHGAPPPDAHAADLAGPQALRIVRLQTSSPRELRAVADLIGR